MKIAILVPSKGLVHASWVENFYKLLSYSQKLYTIDVLFEYVPPPERNVIQQRNALFNRVLKGDHDWVFCLDDDEFPKENALELLVNSDKKVVSGVYAIKNDQDPVFRGTCIGDWKIPKEPKIRLLEELNIGYGCGFGCVLVSMELLKKLSLPIVPEKLPLVNGRYWGEDNAFYIKIINETGEKIWINENVVCGHYDYHTGRMWLCEHS